MDKDGTLLRAQHGQGPGPVEAQDRVAERVLARLCGRPAVRRQPGAAPGGGASAERARQQGAVAPSAARAQRVLAARPRRQGDLRLRVGRHLRPRREDRQDELDGVNGGAVKGAPGVQRRHGLRRQLRGRGLRDRRLERQRQVDGALRRAAGFCAAAASTRPRRWPGAASTSAASTGASTASSRRRASWPGATRPAPRSIRRPRSRDTPTLAADRLRRLAGQALLRARRPHRGACAGSIPVGGVVLGSSSVVGETVYVAMIGPNIGTFGYNVKNGKKVFEYDQGEYNPVISDGKKIYPHRLQDSRRAAARKPARPQRDPRKPSKHSRSRPAAKTSAKKQRRAAAQLSGPGSRPRAGAPWPRATVCVP